MSGSRQVDFSVEDTPPIVLVKNRGLGEGLASQIRQVAFYKSLVAGTNITLSSTFDEITINGVGGGAGVTLASAGSLGSETLVADGTGPDLENKGLVAGSGITLTSDSSDITISADGVTLSSAGSLGSETLVADGTGPDLENKGLVAGSGITLTSDSSDITISADGVTLASAGSVGSETLVADGTGPDLENKGLVAGSGITLTSDSSDITISADGDNSASYMIQPNQASTSNPGGPVAVAYFAWDNSQYSSYSNGTVIFWYQNVTNRDLTVDIFDGSGVIGSTTISSPSANAIGTFSITNPISDVRLELRLSKNSPGGTNPSVFGVQIEF